MTNYLNEHFTTGAKWSASAVTYNALSTIRAAQTYATATNVRFDHTYGIKSLNPADITAVQQVFAEWTKYVNLTASPSSSDAPDITINYAKNIQSFNSKTNSWDNNSGIAYKTVSNGIITKVDILIDPTNSLQKGQWGYETLLHEVGHSLGLFTAGSDDHPHEIAPRSNYTRDNTIMSYLSTKDGVDGSPNATTPAMYDIAALQSLYGQKAAGTSGANTYNFDAGKAKTIWDAGGNDTIDGSNESLDMNLDLRGGADRNNNVHFSYTGLRSIQKENEYYHKLDAVPNSSYIALGYQDLKTDDNPVRIEEARGGSGNDVLIVYDNVAADAIGTVLKGNGGKDTLIGGSGKNDLQGGDGTDFFYADQNDKVDAGAGEDVIAIYKGLGQKGDDIILESNASAQLIGGAGNDHFGIFGRSTIKDIAREDKVYVNNIQVTGGPKPIGFDVPIAIKFMAGHVLLVACGDILQENGATLNIKFLWDNDAIVTIENYTRPYLQQGDGQIIK